VGATIEATVAKHARFSSLCRTHLKPSWSRVNIWDNTTQTIPPISHFVIPAGPLCHSCFHISPGISLHLCATFFLGTVTIGHLDFLYRNTRWHCNQIEGRGVEVLDMGYFSSFTTLEAVTNEFGKAL